jgi:hypothetical protein
VIEELTRPEQKTAPAKRWRNKWRARELCLSSTTNKPMAPGTEWLSRRVYPSKDAAETAAQRRLEQVGSRDLSDGMIWSEVDYLGAFPVDE